MRLAIHAVGRLKAGPERMLVERYADRAGKAGRPLALAPLIIRETAESRSARPDARKQDEATALLAGVAEGSRVVALDENGETMTSDAFAGMLAGFRDGGAGDLAFLIGGADGLGREALARADRRLAFGAMTWPHQIVRALLAEQIYRAITILSGHPYHRA